jgi:hypothetical protein
MSDITQLLERTARAVVAALVGSIMVAADQGVAPSRGTPIRLLAYNGEQLERIHRRPSSTAVVPPGLERLSADHRAGRRCHLA